MYTDLEKINMYKAIIDALTNKPDLSFLCKTAYELYHFPIMVVDVSFKLLFVENGGKSLPDPSWNTIIENGEAPVNDIMDCYFKDGYFDKVTKSDEAVFVDWGITKPYPQFCGSIHIKGNVEGFISVLFMDLDFISQARDLCNMLCSALSIIMQSKRYFMKHPDNPGREILAREIFGGNSEIDIEKFKHCFSLHPKYLIVTIDNKYKDTGKLQYVRNLLCDYYENMLYDVIDKKLYLFFASLMSEERSNQISVKIQQLAKEYDIVCGMSCLFHDLRDRRQYLIQAEKALEVGSLLYTENYVFHFNDIFSDIVISYSAGEMDSINYILPELQMLMDFDQKNSTEYFSTLENYLLNIENVAKTAAKLHIHRNTLTYRLEKIMDIIHLDFNDSKEFARLYMSFQMMRFHTKSVNHPATDSRQKKED